MPSPFFVSSDMVYPIQAADVCIYCVNGGFRLNGMAAPARPEIEGEFVQWLRKLQFDEEGYRDGQVFKTYGVVYVPDPYTSRKA